MRDHRIRSGAILLVLVLTSCGGSDQSAPTTTSASSGTTVAAGASAVDVATDFLDAYGDFDAERALTYLSDEAVAQMWETAELFRLELALGAAMGYEQFITGCEPTGNTGSGVRCGYDFHAIRSDEIGIGPYSDNRWEFAVQDGKIIAASNEIAYETNGFSEQMWEPFAAWVAAKHPDDVQKLYENSSAFRRTEESVQLLEQRSREYAQEHAPSPVTTTPSG